MRLLLLCTALFFGGAAAFEVEPGVFLPTTVTYRCDADLESSLLRQFAEWNAAVDNRFTIRPATADESPVLTLTAIASIDGGYIGYTDALAGSARTQIVMPSLYLDNVMLHELGHAFGLAHSTLTAVMYPVISRTPELLTKDDVDGVRAVYGLPPASFPFTIIKTRVKRQHRTFSFTVSGVANPDWVIWDFGDGIQSIGCPGVHWFVRGRYTVTATYLGYSEEIRIKIP